MSTAAVPNPVPASSTTTPVPLFGCPQCKSTDVFENNIVHVGLPVTRWSPTGEVETYGDWKIHNESISLRQDAPRYYCGKCDHEFEKPADFGDVKACQYARRRSRIEELHVGNDFQVPDAPEQFIAVEFDSDGDPIWAYLADTKEELAHKVENSDTEKVSSIRAFDLDGAATWTAVLKVVEWKEEAASVAY